MKSPPHPAASVADRPRFRYLDHLCRFDRLGRPARALLPVMLALGLSACAVTGTGRPAPAPAASAAAVDGEQTLIFIRHAEKPETGLGMLNCQGLNRALALPAVIAAKFGRPDFVFAPDPHELKLDDGKPYNYLRPLLTVGPTAIQAGLPINTTIGFEDLAGLRAELARPAYANAKVLIGWEHKQLEEVVRQLVVSGGGAPGSVPRWRGSDFDGIHVVTVRRQGGRETVSFRHESEGLNGQTKACPAAPARP